MRAGTDQCCSSPACHVRLDGVSPARNSHDHVGEGSGLDGAIDQDAILSTLGDVKDDHGEDVTDIAVSVSVGEVQAWEEKPKDRAHRRMRTKATGHIKTGHIEE